MKFFTPFKLSLLLLIGSLSYGAVKYGPYVVQRGAIATGTANHVVINGSDGAISSEAALDASRGGTGVANNAAATLTRSGSHALTLTTSATTALTLPTVGTLVAADNFGITTSAASNALTVSFVGANGSALSSTNVARVAFRNATATTGTPTVATLSAAPTALVMSSGSTAGFVSGLTHYAYIYLFDDAGTYKLGFGQPYLDDGALQSSTDEAGNGDSNAVIYTTDAVTAVSSKAVRMIARIKFTLTTAGTWNEAGDEISLAPFDKPTIVAIYTTNTASAVDNATAVVYEDRVQDSCGGYNTSTGVYTVCMPGIYLVNANIRTANVLVAAAEVLGLKVVQAVGTSVTLNGSMHAVEAASTVGQSRTLGGLLFNCAAGDTLTIQYEENIGAVNLDGSGEQNNMSIVRIGP